MKRTEQNSTQLRQQAEAQFTRAPNPELRSADELLHELQIHQIELEMQNEQLRQTQLELEESRGRYLNLYDFAPIGYLSLSHEGLIDKINLTGAALLEVARNKLAHRRFDSFVVQEDRERWYRHFLDVLSHDTTLPCELELQRSNGLRFYARLDCLCLSQECKEAEVRIALTDISACKRVEKSLRDSRKNLNRLLNSMAEGAFGVDTDGNCTFVNQSFLRILGYRDEHEILGKHIHELIHHSHADGSPYPASECNAYLAHQSEQLRDVSDEVFWRKDGVAIPVEYWSHPVKADGVVIGSIVTFFDIGKRKRAQSLVNAQIDELRRWQEATLGRETRVLDLKHEVNSLLLQAKQPPRYPSAE